MEREPILELNTGKITALLERGEKTLVQDVELSLCAGEKHALIGETGSGKTMTALQIMRLLPENVRSDGERIRFCGEDLPKGRAMNRLRGSGIVYIPQNGAEFLNPSRKVGAQIRDGLRKNGVPLSQCRERIRELLEAAGFEEPERVAGMYPFELSGGMAQRVAIALAACSRARLILADEPTNGLDRKLTEKFLSLLDSMFDRAAILVITHDISVASLCGRITVLCRGRMCESGPAQDILGSPKHPYTRALIGALVENGMKETPVLREDNGRCPFSSRCVTAGDDCSCGPEKKTEADREWWCSKV